MSFALIVCKHCGHNNEDGATFCGSCGSFLEWTGEKLEKPPPEPDPEPAPSPAVKTGLVTEARIVLGLEQNPQKRAAEQAIAEQAERDRTERERDQQERLERERLEQERLGAARLGAARLLAAREAAAAEQERLAPSTADGAAGERAAAEQAAAEKVEHERIAAVNAAERASALASLAKPTAVRPASPPVVRPLPLPPAGTFSASPTLAPGQSSPQQPIAVKPAAARTRTAPRTAAPTRQLNPGDLVCGQCGEGNDPARKFCHRCGSTLAEAVVVGTPWWKRLFRRPRKQVPAGTRVVGLGAGRHGAGTMFNALRQVVLALLSVVVVFVVLLMLVSAPFRGALTGTLSATVAGVRHLVAPTYSQVHAVSAVANGDMPGHPATSAIDGYANTWWAVNLKSDPSPAIKMTFDRQINLGKIIVSSGQRDQFDQHPRPESLHLVFSNGTSQDIKLNDEKKPQTFDVDAPGISTVEIHVMSAYQSLAGAPDLSLSEVEFYRRN